MNAGVAKRRGLALVALTLAVLLAAVAYLGASRLGHLEPPRTMDLEFRNYTLDAKPGDSVEVRPLVADVPSLRYTVYRLEPSPGVTKEWLFGRPYWIVSVAVKHPEGEDYVGNKPGPLVLAGLGSMNPLTWLERLVIVLDKGPDGVTREVVCAAFGLPDGARHLCFYDPEHAVVPAGWYRMEVLTPGSGDRELYFAEAGERP